MTKIPYTKAFLPYSDQINLLKSRGLELGNENKILHLLENISYYRLSAYWHPLLADKDKHIFKHDANFETAFSLYKFDKELRKLIVAELEKIEIAVRSKMIHILSMTHGFFWIDDASLFVNPKKYKTTITKINDEFSRSDEEFISSFKSKYSNLLPPAFMTLEISSFGTLSLLYNNLKPGSKKREIANYFGLPDTVFSSWLHSIVYIRNVCAHHSRLWNRLMSIQPLSPKNPKNPWLTNSQISNKRVYYLLSMIVYLLNTVNPNHTFKQKIETLLLKYPNIDIRAMGFPSDWKSEALWK